MSAGATAHGLTPGPTGVRREMPSAEVRAVEVDGSAARYRVAGSGEPLVLVHGLAGSWRWWTPVFGALAARRRVYLIDLPHLHRGWGVDRVSAWLACLLDAAEVGPTDLVAHSLGGLFAAELAASEPERVRRLVLVAPAGIPDELGLAGQVVSLGHALYDVRRWLPMICGDVLRSGPLSLAHGIDFVARRDLRGELGVVQAPTLLVWGERDRLVPFWLAQEWQRLLPRARLVRLRCGHVPMLEAPQEFAAATLAFLEEEPLEDRGD